MMKPRNLMKYLNQQGIHSFWVFIYASCKMNSVLHLTAATIQFKGIMIPQPKIPIKKQKVSLKKAQEGRKKLKKYQKMLKSRAALPIADLKGDILHLMEENDVLVICGETGCGKTTQNKAPLLYNWHSFENVFRKYKPGWFSHIIVDEVHERWSQWKEMLFKPKTLTGIGMHASDKLGRMLIDHGGKL
ncbi:hypothetical protein K7X08_028892 [Anisodus acutangulus]|uniref:RNA helicase n=1 Tax=Anisodus acutangulus TaxID=402998 RepID=A0A9Q1QVE3_9SOLA|nr:hypothetical protein K7X08_028892 [Anisodus acutangulus]